MRSRLLLFLGLLMCFSPVKSSEGAIITQWDFNGPSGVSTPSVGAGIVNLMGVSATFASGNADGGSSDPNTSAQNFGWQTTSYPSQNQSSRTEGIEFFVSTAGFNNVTLTWDQRNSNTASRFWGVDYTVDGVNWLPLAGSYALTSGSTWFNGQFADFSSITSADDNANFGVRILSIFEPATSGYTPTQGATYNGGTGTARFDMITFSGTAVPDPSTIEILALLSGTWWWRNRRRRVLSASDTTLG